MESASNGTPDGESDDPKMEILRLTQKIQELQKEGDASAEDVADYLGAMIVKLIEMEECPDHGESDTEDLTLRVSIEDGAWSAEVGGLCCARMNEQAEHRAEETLQRLLPR